MITTSRAEPQDGSGLGQRRQKGLQILLDNISTGHVAFHACLASFEGHMQDHYRGLELPSGVPTQLRMARMYWDRPGRGRVRESAFAFILQVVKIGWSELVASVLAIAFGGVPSARTPSSKIVPSRLLEYRSTLLTPRSSDEGSAGAAGYVVETALICEF